MFFSLRGSIGEITSIKTDGITESRAHGRRDSPGVYYAALLCDVLSETKVCELKPFGIAGGSSTII